MAGLRLRPALGPDHVRDAAGSRGVTGGRGPTILDQAGRPGNPGLAEPRLPVTRPAVSAALLAGADAAYPGTDASVWGFQGGVTRLPLDNTREIAELQRAAPREKA